MRMFGLGILRYHAEYRRRERRDRGVWPRANSQSESAVVGIGRAILLRWFTRNHVPRWHSFILVTSHFVILIFTTMVPFNFSSLYKFKSKFWNLRKIEDLSQFYWDNIICWRRNCIEIFCLSHTLFFICLQMNF